MAGDSCMFCGEIPCTCTGKKKSGLVRKPLAKREPVEKPRLERPKVQRESKPKPVKPAPPKLERERSADPELEQLVRTLDYLDMLHPDEKAKYAETLRVPKTTGRLLEGGDRSDRST